MKTLENLNVELLSLCAYTNNISRLNLGISKCGVFVVVTYPAVCLLNLFGVRTSQNCTLNLHSKHWYLLWNKKYKYIRQLFIFRPLPSVFLNNKMPEKKQYYFCHVILLVKFMLTCLKSQIKMRVWSDKSTNKTKWCYILIARFS